MESEFGFIGKTLQLHRWKLHSEKIKHAYSRVAYFVLSTHNIKHNIMLSCKTFSPSIKTNNYKLAFRFQIKVYILTRLGHILTHQL